MTVSVGVSVFVGVKIVSVSVSVRVMLGESVKVGLGVGVMLGESVKVGVMSTAVTVNSSSLHVSHFVFTFALAKFSLVGSSPVYPLGGSSFALITAAKDDVDG